MTGATGSPGWSSRTPDSGMRATPSPPIAPGGQSAKASVTADFTASSKAFASSSAPDPVTVHGVVARPDATGSPSSVKRTALLVLVPTARPTNRVPRMSLPRPPFLSNWNVMDIVAFRWNHGKRSRRTSMPLARTADLVAAAYRAGTGLAAFNVITLESAEAIVAGAEKADRPVILQISENAVKFHHGRLAPIAAATTAVAAAAAIPVSVHLDHVEDEQLLYASAENGVSSAMFDASKLDYDANVTVTKAAAEWAHRHGMFLEAELGEVGGKDGAHAPGVRTDPAEAAVFVEATGVDALAV